ncbi:nitroreductase family protein [Candidatus Bathyarchaeota archaeon]|nr:nitroreductase family protein [Candidatus Bathyarchaeota archaeon]
MDFMEVVKTRRSIRRYKPDSVPDEILNQILEAARLAPSAGHRQPWHFIVVKNPETKKQLGISSWAVEAPVVIVGCGDAGVSPTLHMVDLAIAFEHLVLAATNFGLGTCWIGKLGIDETIKKVLRIPEHVKVVAVTPLGYPAETPSPKARKSMSEIVHYEKF